jgi:hypothetical protein
MRMQFHNLMQVLPNIASALGTSDCAGLLFVHQNAASGTEPSPSEVVASACEAELFGLLDLAHKAGIQSLRDMLG